MATRELSFTDEPLKQHVYPAACANSPAPEDPGAADEPPAVDGVSLDFTVALGPAPPASAAGSRVHPAGSDAANC
jgi:hypothetical protein